MPIAIQALLRAILAAFVAIGTKVLATAFIERIVAAVTFWGLSKLAQRSDNMLDDQLVHEAAVAYYGAGSPEAESFAVRKPSGSPEKPDVQPEGTNVQVAPVEPIPEAPVGRPDVPPGAPVGAVRGLSQESRELNELR